MLVDVFGCFLSRYRGPSGGVLRLSMLRLSMLNCHARLCPKPADFGVTDCHRF